MAISRRLFIGEPNQYHQLLTLTQNKDGSIYCFPQESDKIIWQRHLESSNSDILQTTRIESPCKLSIHGSGTITLRAHEEKENNRKLITPNALYSEAKKTVGFRYLFTLFPKNPIDIAKGGSPAFKRKSDYVLEIKKLTPFVLIFFAIPSITPVKEFNYQINFESEEIELPPSVSSGTCPLLYHNVFWLSYSTKSIVDWPPFSHYVHNEGYYVPLYKTYNSKGSENKKYLDIGIEIMVPSFEMTNEVLSMKLLKRIPPKEQ